MNSERLVKRIYKWKPLETKNGGRPMNGWEDDVMKNLKLLKIKNWTQCIQSREEWRRIVEKVKTVIELSCSTLRRRGENSPM
jgi:hypothetical protein